MRHVGKFFHLLVVVGVAVLVLRTRTSPSLSVLPSPTSSAAIPLSILGMRTRQYPGSDFAVSQTLPDTAGYHQEIVSYQSDGLTLYGLLTIPKGSIPPGGWPAILFNHGYVDPRIYTTTSRYVQFVADLTNAGYVVFKPDYRGNGSSQGKPDSPYFSPNYAIDDLNALSSLRRDSRVNPAKIGIWGHSMGGNVTMRVLVTNTTDIRAAVIWSGVVGTYDEIINHWQNMPDITYNPSPYEMGERYLGKDALVGAYGEPLANQSFWNTIDPTHYLADITIPVQLEISDHDNEVPHNWSEQLYSQLKNLGKTTELYTYPGTDHNILPPNYATAMARTIEFFNRYVK